MTTSAEIFIRFVSEKHTELKNSLSALVKHLIGENKAAKEKLIVDTLHKAENLQNAMAKNDVPSWLQQLIYHLSRANKPRDPKNEHLIDFLLK